MYHTGLHLVKILQKKKKKSDHCGGLNEVHFKSQSN